MVDNYCNNSAIENLREYESMFESSSAFDPTQSLEKNMAKFRDTVPAKSKKKESQAALKVPFVSGAIKAEMELNVGLVVIAWARCVLYSIGYTLPYCRIMAFYSPSRLSRIYENE
jgi:hypothetical protein